MSILLNEFCKKRTRNISPGNEFAIAIFSIMNSLKALVK